MFGDMSPKNAPGFLKGFRGLAAPLRELVAMGFDLVEQVFRGVQIVAAGDEEASGRGVAQQGRDQDVRVDDELQGPSPGTRCPPLSMLLPDALLDRLGDLLDVSHC